jgi:uncharacterized membrane protein YfcA
MSMSTFDLMAISMTFLVAGIVKGVTGMGLPTVAMGVLGSIMLPAEAASLLIVPSLVTNLWQLFAGGRVGALLRRFWLMMLCVMAGTWVTIPFMTGGSSRWPGAGLGVALSAYALLGLASWRFTVPPRRERVLSPVVGLATGMVTGATGVFVIPAVPYIQSLNLKKEALVQALGLSFTVSTIGLALGLVLAPVIAPILGAIFEPLTGAMIKAGPEAASGLSMAGVTSAFPSVGEITAGIMRALLATVPALLGMAVGQSIRERISPATFRRWFFICLLVLGLQLLARAIW